MKSNKSTPVKHNQAATREKIGHKLFDKGNYKWMIIGAVIMTVGFLLMAGGKSDDPAVFSDTIYSFRRITLAPILIVVGLVIEVYAIMKKN